MKIKDCCSELRSPGSQPLRFQDDSSNEEGTIWESLNNGLPDTRPLAAAATRPTSAIKAAHTHTKTHTADAF